MIEVADVALDLGRAVAVLDLLATFVFALSGCLLALRRRLDLFGAAVLALAAGGGGGTLRDVLLGDVPPPFVSEWRYPAVVLAAVGVGLLVHRIGTPVRRPVLVADALGLGLFAVVGTRKALDLGATPTTAIVLGVVTGVGGGIVRDVLAGEVPVVLRREIYAVAALVGAVLVVLGDGLDLRPAPVAVAAAVVTSTLRLLALRLDWHLTPPPPASPRAGREPPQK